MKNRLKLWENGTQMTQIFKRRFSQICKRICENLRCRRHLRYLCAILSDFSTNNHNLLILSIRCSKKIFISTIR
jgi:hypothetical protein